MTALARFLTYIGTDTASDETSEATPSTPGQSALAAVLVGELRALGLTDAEVDPAGYVYAALPAAKGCEDAPRLGFIAHMDTSPDCSGRDIHPRLLPDYDGGRVLLGAAGPILTPEEFPELAAARGRTLVVTDGTTLLGADDKAGIAEIMTLLEHLTAGNLPHGRIAVCFTPDEEIGRGADLFDVSRFGADFAYTLDGDAEGGIEYENFNAAAAEITLRGVSIHPGDGKGKLRNASLLAMEFGALLPAEQTPSRTEGYEGFFHLIRMEGSVEKATLSYLLRDHDPEKFEKKKLLIRAICAALNEKYGPGTAVYTLHDQYHNMAEVIDSFPHLIENAVRATQAAGLTPVIKPIRGGTDGARLSFMGLPCPNLGTGGHAFHGPFEHITAEAMEDVVRILEHLVALYAGKEDGRGNGRFS